MQKDKLKEIGKKLGVSGSDVSNIKREYWKSYLLYIGAAIIVATILFVLGCCIGPVHNAANNAGHTVVHNGYPYGLVLPGITARGRKTKIAAFLLGTATMLILASTPVFGQGIEYNVFRREI